MKESHRIFYKDLVCWARNGLICIENKKNGDFQVMTVSTFLPRLRAILKESELYLPDERNKCQNFIDEAIKLCKIAHKQGRPDHESSKEFIVNHPSIHLPKLILPPDFKNKENSYN
jgi:hypothetical protein